MLKALEDKICIQLSEKRDDILIDEWVRISKFMYVFNNDKEIEQ